MALLSAVLAILLVLVVTTIKIAMSVAMSARNSGVTHLLKAPQIFPGPIPPR